MRPVICLVFFVIVVVGLLLLMVTGLYAAYQYGWPYGFFAGLGLVLMLIGMIGIGISAP